MTKSPLPTEDFKGFAEHQKQLLFEETESFFKQHNLHLKKYVLPVPLPSWAESLDQVLDTGVEHEPYTTIYRHRHFLKARVLRNWSYIETIWNVSGNPRNKNIPFDLRPLTREIINQLDATNTDIADPEFSGLMVTLNTQPFTSPPPSDASKGTDAQKSDDVNSDGQAPINTNAGEPSKESATQDDKADSAAPVNSNATQCKSKIIAGAIVECLMTNERCIRCIWVHPHLSKHSSRVLLQAFLPRLMLEIFNVPSVMTEEGPSPYHKFAYAMHNDLDMFPRQCWLLLASVKKMSLPRHYEPSTFDEHPVDLEYGECHTDEAGPVLLPKFTGIVDEGILTSVGTEESVRGVACTCYTEKMKKSVDAQAWLDRLIGCTEAYMCILLPKRSEREALGLLQRDGWRDLIVEDVDRALLEELLELLPMDSRNRFPHLYDPSVATVNVRCNANLNSDLEEWCKLRCEDLIDITSDTELDAYVRVVLLGVHGWDPQVLYAIKVHFSSLLPEDRRSELKICIVPATRPLNFFNVSIDADWYFFVANEQEVALERSIQERELVGGIYSSTPITSLMASVTKTVHDSSRAAILYASALAILSRMEHSGILDSSINTQITKIFQEISMLDGGPYVQYDSERSAMPLILFMSLEEALKISPYVFIYDPSRTDILAELRIQCELLVDEFTSEFCNLNPKLQPHVLRKINGRIKRIERSQLVWLRRTCTMPCLDMMYILIAISVGWLNKENESTVDTAPAIASDFIYNILSDRISQESFYDRVIMTKLVQKTSQMLLKTYDMISSSKIKSRMFGAHKVLFTTLHPKHTVVHIDELRFVGFVISSLHSHGVAAEGLCRVLLFIQNVDSEGILAYGYSPEVTGNFPDIWALVFRSLAHDDTTYIFDALRPTCMDIQSLDVDTAKNKITERLRIALEAKQASYFDDSEDQTEEEVSFAGSDAESVESE
ncbi:hypothetical protein BaOVIS_016870 [Babesia ovis]|uniref:Uncharacterized protein n=1 Tax=Babesia ovis TaxID=5869 RepID=A0A9W5WUU8_BABOV|nr:hypothetical protein BaOVIS_016870 [Babesia ovis]